MQQGCLPGFSFMGKFRDKERILVIVLDELFSPGNRPCRPPTPLDRSRALGGGRDEVGLGPLLYLLAAAATTKSEPRKKSLGIGKRGARQPRDKNEVSHTLVRFRNA